MIRRAKRDEMDLEQGNSMDRLIWETENLSDEELLDEYEAVKRMTGPFPILSRHPDEFEKIWRRILEERADLVNSPETDQPARPKVIRARFRWKRLAMVVLVVCLIVGSGCMVAMGTRFNKVFH